MRGSRGGKKVSQASLTIKHVDVAGMFTFMFKEQSGRRKKRTTITITKTNKQQNQTKSKSKKKEGFHTTQHPKSKRNTLNAQIPDK